MRLVVDTNVFVSAALKEASWPAETVRWIERHGGLLKTEVTEKELEKVLQRSRINPKVSQSFRDRLRRVFIAAELVPIVEAVSGCRDPSDDKFLELAVNGRADVIISGDDDLLVIGAFRGIPIITPAAFGSAQLESG